jgi:hypothetical protein
MNGEWISAMIAALTIIVVLLLLVVWIYVIYMTSLVICGIVFASTAWYLVCFVMLLIFGVFRVLLNYKKKVE